jgi:hypothetical protein
MHTQVQDLTDQVHLKDQEIFRLKRVKTYKHFPVPETKTKLPPKKTKFDKPTQTPYSHV